MNRIDEIYRDYFRHEMPRTLPPLPVNEPAGVTTAPRPANGFVLAASVAALLGLGLWQAGQPQARPRTTAEPPSLLNSATADGATILKPATNETPNK
jgi:hypothetical protein